MKGGLNRSKIQYNTTGIHTNNILNSFAQIMYFKPKYSYYCENELYFAKPQKSVLILPKNNSSDFY